MADKTISVLDPFTLKMLRDQGDGTHAEVVAIGAVRAVTTATISSGTAATPAVNLGNRSLVGIALLSGAWTAAALSVEVSPDGAVWLNPFDASGVATGSIAAPAVGQGYAVDTLSLLPWQYIRLRSSVNQAADRVITLITRALA